MDSGGMDSGEQASDRPVGTVRWTGSEGAPLTTPRVDLLVAGAGAIVAAVVGVLAPVNPAFSVLVGGPVAGLLNRVYDAELAAGFLAGLVGTVLVAVAGLATSIVTAELTALGGMALVAPFLGLVTGGLTIVFGRARERFGAGRRSVR